MKTASELNNDFKQIPIIKNLNSAQLEAMKFGLGATFLGTTSGLIFGGVTTLMRGLQETPAGRANILRSFKLFSNCAFFKIFFYF
jgi:uncharacterized protein YaaQ